MNYTDLKAAITDWAHRSNIDAGVIDTFIDLAEAEFNVRLRTVDQEKVAELLCTTRYTPLPADWLEMRAVEYQGETVRNLTYATPEMISQWRKAAPSGSTLAYTLRGAHIEVLPNIGADEPSVDGFGDDAQPFEDQRAPESVPLRMSAAGGDLDEGRPGRRTLREPAARLLDFVEGE